MKLSELKRKRLLPLHDFVAFKWLKPKLKSGILIPDSHYGLELQVGKFYIGEVIAIGSKVKEVKLKYRILVAEYGIKDFKGAWNEDEIYFIEEKFVHAQITGFRGLIQRVLTKDQR